MKHTTHPVKRLLLAVMAGVLASQPVFAQTYQFNVNVPGFQGPEQSLATPEPEPTPSAYLSFGVSRLDFGTRAPGTTASLTTVLRNTGKAEATGIAFSGLAQSAFTSTTCAATLPAGGNCKVTVTFTSSSTGSKAAMLVASTSGGAAAQLPLTGATSGTTEPVVTPPSTPASGSETPATEPAGSPALQLSPVQAVFGQVPRGSTSAAHNVQLTNSGTAAAQISSISVTEGGSVFSASSGCGAQLAAGESCNVAVTFSPAAGVGYLGKLAFNFGNANALVAPLSGTGTAPVIGMDALNGNSQTTVGGVPHLAVNFGNQSVGQSSTAATVRVRNNGSAPMTISGVSVASGADSFGQSNDCGTAVEPSSACSVSVQFTPKTAGSKTGSVAVASDGGTAILDLSGTAQLPLTAQLSGTFDTVTAPTTSFGTVSQPGTKDLTVYVKSAGDVGTLTSSATLTGDTSQIYLQAVGKSTSSYQAGTGYVADKASCGATVGATSSSTCTSDARGSGGRMDAYYTLRFAPTADGLKSVTLTINQSAGAPLVLTITGTGVALVQGGQLYTSSGTYAFTVPTGVTALHVVAVGGGGGGGKSYANAGGGGGALAYVNNIAVTPGEQLIVEVGAGSAPQSSNGVTVPGGDSGVKRSTTWLVRAGGGNSAYGTASVSASAGTGGAVKVGTGGAGGSGVTTQYTRPGGGGGAGGYAGKGGNGGGYNSYTGKAGAGGAGGGGGGNSTTNSTGGGGGGVGLYGQGADGAAAAERAGGEGGSGGADGALGAAGAFGGGGAGGAAASAGAGGGVRIIWGTGRAFPSTNVSTN